MTGRRPVAATLVGGGPALAGPLVWWSGGLTAPWAVPVGVVAGVVVGIFVYYGGSPGSLVGRTGLANAVTVLRGAGLAGLAAFLAVDPPTAWLPAGVYAGVALLDRVDGAVARRLDAVTDLGSALDREYDALGLAVGPLVAAALGLGPAWFAVLGAVRVPFLGHLTLRRRRGLPLDEMPPSRLRRPLAGAAMVATVALLAPLVGPAAGRALAVVVAVAFLLQYAADWLAIVRPGATATDALSRVVTGRGGDA